MRVIWRSARAIRAPVRVRVDCGVARYIHDNSPATFARRRGQPTQQCLRQPKRSQHIRLERQREILTRRVGQWRKRDGTEARCIVDEHIEPAAPAEHLQRERLYRVLVGDVAGDAERSRQPSREVVDAISRPSDERDISAALVKRVDQCKSEPGRAAGYQHAHPLTRIEAFHMMIVHLI